MFKRDEVNISTTTMYREFEADPNLLDMGKLGFALGIRFISKAQNSSKVLDKSYFSLKYTTVNTTREAQGIDNSTTVLNEFQWENCSYHFDDIVTDEFATNFQLDKFFCPNTKEYMLGGNFVSSQVNFIAITLDKCTGESYCQTPAEIDKVTEDLLFVFSPPTYFFNSEKFKEPITLSVGKQNEFSIINGFKQSLNINIQVNEAKLYDSYWSDYINEEHQYMSVGDIYNTLAKEGTDGRLLDIKLIQDQRYTKTERRIYSILDILGQVGGVQGLIIPLGAWMVEIFSSKIYLMTLLSLFYQVETKHKIHKVVPTELSQMQMNKKGKN